MAPTFVASELMLESVQRHKIHLSLLVADTGLWVNPRLHQQLIENTASAAMFPQVRRARISQGEKRGKLPNGNRLDDNSYANLAIKRAMGLGGGRAEGFEACHIWPLTCYDERYHTALANLVLLPRALAGLTDHDVEIQKSLQYRAYELYCWKPEGQSTPLRPDFYPAEWREPQPYPEVLGKRFPSLPQNPSPPTVEPISGKDPRTLMDRISGWSSKPDLIVHKIIALVAMADAGMFRDQLVKRVSELTNSKSPYGAIASLLTDSGNSYGRVFEECGGVIRIRPDLVQQVRSLSWRRLLENHSED